MAQIYTVSEGDKSELGKVIGDARDNEGKYRNEQIDIHDKDVEVYIFQEWQTNGIGINVRMFGFYGNEKRMATQAYTDLVNGFNSCVDSLADNQSKTVEDCMREYQIKARENKFNASVLDWGVEILNIPSMLPPKEGSYDEGQSIDICDSEECSLEVIHDEEGKPQTYILPYANRQYKFFSKDNENIYFYLVTKIPEETT